MITLYNYSSLRETIARFSMTSAFIFKCFIAVLESNAWQNSFTNHFFNTIVGCFFVLSVSLRKSPCMFYECTLLLTKGLPVVG